MFHQLATSVFLIKRLHVELMVVLYATGLVKIEPYRCTDKNLRLWSVIAKTQSVRAQTQLGLASDENRLQLLYSVFRNSGWDVNELEESEECLLQTKG